MAQRIENLDALRGIAAMSVFAHHATYAALRHFSMPPIVKILLSSAILDHFNLGRFGVVLFFLLSGYVIPISFRGERPYFDFAISRIFRLYPAYWASLLAVLLIMPLITSAHFEKAQILANSTMFQKLLRQADVNGVYWSLFIEIIFYFCCIGLFATRQLRETRALAAATILCTLATTFPLAANALFSLDLPVQFLTQHLSFLFLGGLLRNALAERQSSAILPCAMTMAIVLIGVTLISCLATPNHAAHVPVGGKVGIAAAYVAAMALFTNACLNNWPRGKLLIWLGGISYPVYLLHPVALSIILHTMAPRGNGQAIIYFVLALGLTLLAGEVCYRFIEKPSIALGKAIRFGTLRKRVLAKTFATGE